MVHKIVEEVRKFGVSLVAVTVLVLLAAGTILLADKVGWKLPIDPVQLAHRLVLGENHKPASSPVNVQFRDADDALADLSPYIDVWINNGHGNPYKLEKAHFFGCDSDVIKAGAEVHLDIQRGIISESLKVRLDETRQILFIKSQYTKKEILAKINGQDLLHHTGTTCQLLVCTEGAHFGEAHQSYQNKIDRKSLNFVLCNPHTFAVEIIIEFDDKFHTREDRKISNDF